MDAISNMTAIMSLPGPKSPATINARYLVTQGINDRKKIAELTGCHPRSISRYLREKKMAGAGKENKKRGPDATLNCRALDSLRRIGLRSPELSNPQLARRLEKRGHPLVSPRTIGRALKTLGFKRMVPQREPLLSAAHKVRRLAWCIAHRDTDWSKLIFTDESSLQFAPYRQKLLVLEGHRRLVTRTSKRVPLKWFGAGSLSAG